MADRPARIDTSNIETQRVEHDGVPLTVARPTGEARGAVIVVQEAFGVTPHIADVAARAAVAGYLSVAPHLFHRSVDSSFGYDQLDLVLPEMAKINAETLTADLDGAVAYLHENGFSDRAIGTVGFCMGGSVTLYAAATRELGAAVTFYGGGLSTGRFGLSPLLDYAPNFSTPWLGLFGSADPGIPVEEVQQLKAAATKAPVPTEVVIYEGANHGFHCDDRPAAFDPKAAADGWERTLAWFAEYVES